ncbi:unnamed protein product [Orchesella dallaii]|uniref:Solute carrier family 23 member 2 n=1 Tax=Orchesella dallaii TaxID=48710 RepID=A0ABP1PJY4_9HEXA
MENPAVDISSEKSVEMEPREPKASVEREVFYNGEPIQTANGIKQNESQLDHINFLENTEETLLYGLLDVPPWYISICLGLQHNLEMVTAAVAIPFLLTPALCMENDDPDKGKIISTLIFMSGIITILQSTFGNTLPIVQGGSFSYLVPSLAIMSLPKWKCPSLNGLSPEQKTEEWQIRMREIQGAILFASMFEMFLALTGCIGYLTKFVTPITIAPAITLIGLSLFKNVMVQCSKNYYVSAVMVLLLIIFSQHLRNLKIPIFWNKRLPSGKRSTFPIFQVFPILLALLIVWAGCGILTVFDVLPAGDPARVDVKKRIIEETDWFRVPYPFQWGIPTVSIGAVLGILCGVLTSTVESIGDYYSCASIIRAPVPPEHAMNRGIFMEGLGCVLSGIMGTGNASTSYSHNIGTLAVTKVGSRRVIQIAGVIMICLGLVGKAGAVFVSLPDPILGGMFLFLFPLVMAVGIGTLKDVNLESSRNVFIVSFSIFLGLAVSQWMNSNPGLINTGIPELDSLIQILLSTGMFVAGITAFVLDNTVSGTNEERGLTKRQDAAAASKLYHDTTYDLPVGMGIIKRFRIFKWIPISPTFDKHPITLLNCKSDSANFTLPNENLPTYLKKTGHDAH